MGARGEANAHDALLIPAAAGVTAGVLGSTAATKRGTNLSSIAALASAEVLILTAALVTAVHVAVSLFITIVNVRGVLSVEITIGITVSAGSVLAGPIPTDQPIVAVRMGVTGRAHPSACGVGR